MQMNGVPVPGTQVPPLLHIFTSHGSPAGKAEATVRYSVMTKRTAAPAGSNQKPKIYQKKKVSILSRKKKQRGEILFCV